MWAKEQDAFKRAYEEQIYKQISDEIKADHMCDGLWLKALSESNNCINEAKVMYVKLRYKSIIDEEIIKDKRKKNTQLERERVEEENKNESEGYVRSDIIPVLILLIIIITAIIIVCIEII